MANERSLKEIGSHKGKKNYLKMQLEISLFGNHAASRKNDKLLSATEQRLANGRNKESNESSSKEIGSHPGEKKIV